MKLLTEGEPLKAIEGELILGPKNAALYAAERAQNSQQQPFGGYWQGNTSSVPVSAFYAVNNVTFTF